LPLASCQTWTTCRWCEAAEVIGSNGWQGDRIDILLVQHVEPRIEAVLTLLGDLAGPPHVRAQDIAGFSAPLPGRRRVDLIAGRDQWQHDMRPFSALQKVCREIMLVDPMRHDEDAPGLAVVEPRYDHGIEGFDGAFNLL
jgi:hypothetical protein